MRILITGGAGYIGSHMARTLAKLGHTPIVLDTLEFGHPEALKDVSEVIKANCSDEGTLDKIFTQDEVTACIHFAGYIQVGESMQNPAKYFDNNLSRPAHLLQQLIAHKIKYFIFSSTAAVYGLPTQNPIPETHPQLPINPYGLSKLAFEQLLNYYDRVYGLKSIALRYFNACGASLDSLHGEAHQPESHLIPKTILSALNHQTMTINGQDFATPDGTCMRDYIHIEDLCSAHLKALEALMSGHPSDVFNVGTGSGHTNLEVVEAVKRISGIDFPVDFGPRRAGDPDALVADTSKIRSALSWAPAYSDLDTIIKTAFAWHSACPNGYASMK